MIGPMLLAAAQAAAPETLKPEGSWTLDDGRGCTVSRTFVSAAGPVTLGIKPNVGVPGGELVLVLPGRGARYEVDEGRIVLDEGGPSFPAVWSRVGRRDQPLNGVTVQPDDRFWGTLPGARMLTIDVGKRQQVRLATGSMGGVAAALDKCRSDKLVALPKR